MYSLTVFTAIVATLSGAGAIPCCTAREIPGTTICSEIRDGILLFVTPYHVTKGCLGWNLYMRLTISL